MAGCAGRGDGMTRRPYENSKTAAMRLRGRALQRRNNRIRIRDSYTCQACNRVTEQGEVDHLVPLSKGGADDDSNCRWTCVPCHTAKSRAEAGGKAKVEIGPDGWPISARVAAREKPGSHWNR